MYIVTDRSVQIEYFCFHVWERSLVLILRVFCIRSVYRGLMFFTLVLILRIRAYLVTKGDQFFSNLGFFFSARKIIQFLREIECIKFVCNKFVLVWENCQNVITKLNCQFMALTDKGLFLIYIKNREVCQNIITKWTCQFMDLTDKAMIVVSSLGFWFLCHHQNPKKVCYNGCSWNSSAVPQSWLSDACLLVMC